jgi:hypothetical protein
MADKYKYTQAYHDVYSQIEKPTLRKGYTLSLDSCSEQEKNEAVKYLYLAKKGKTPPSRKLYRRIEKNGIYKMNKVINVHQLSVIFMKERFQSLIGVQAFEKLFVFMPGVALQNPILHKYVRR